MDDMPDKGMYGCLAIFLFFVFMLVVSIAVGVFFGVGFGLLTYALFLLFAIVCVIRAFEKAGN